MLNDRKLPLAESKGSGSGAALRASGRLFERSIVRNYPKVSVIICTRDRGDQVLRTIRSVLRNRYPAYEVIIVDQSREPIEHGLTSLFHDDRVRYRHSTDFGLSRGRNLGAGLSRGEIVAFTDDDCEVQDDWIDKIIDAFALNDRIQIVFGSVAAASYDLESGLIPHYLIREPFVARSVLNKWRINGMGACMALRRNIWIKLSGFDVCLGAGTPLHSGEDTDFALRTLISGNWIYETPSVKVKHFGFVAREGIHDLIAGYMLGTGAAFAKQMRLADRNICRLFTHMLWQWIFKMPSVRYVSSHKRILRLLWFSRGFITGMKIPLDRASGHFAAKGFPGGI